MLKLTPAITPDRSLKRLAACAASLLLALSAAAPAVAQDAVESFYRGKQIRFYIGYAPGGGYDTYARLVGRFMGKHIPGHPEIVPQNMPGGGTRAAAGYVYNVAPKDGTALGIADQSLPLQQAVGDKSLQFDLTKFNYIGNPAADINTVAVWHTTGVKSIDDAKTKEVTIGATGPNTSAQIPMTINAVLGTKFKVVRGYPGGNDINLAMERGEVGGRGSSPWSTWKSTRPDWIKDKLITVIAQIGLTKTPELPGVPLLMDLATNEEDRAVLRLISAPATVGRPIFAPPGVPEERVKALRRAFDATMKDPEFVESARQASIDLDPVSGEELQKIVADIVNTPKPAAERLAKIFEQVQ
jgi:tripartite-type tricarboxylate transporter receptor subunit TctC